MKIKKDDAGYAMKAARKLAGEFGKFYTPESVCRLIARLAYVPNARTVYDPTCGTGSLLLYGYDTYGNKPKLIGWEIVKESCRLARENMIANGVENFEIVERDTLAQPFDGEYDIVLGNPPFSVYWEQRVDDRFIGGLAPKSKADWAFVQHSWRNLSRNGKMAFILPPGAANRPSEDSIRNWFINQGAINAVILLPSKLFEETSIATVAVVFSHGNDSVYFLDASGMASPGKIKKQDVLTDETNDRIVSMVERREVVEYLSTVARPNGSLLPTDYVKKKETVERILTPIELIDEYRRKRSELTANIDATLNEIVAILGERKWESSEEKTEALKQLEKAEKSKKDESPSQNGTLRLLFD